MTDQEKIAALAIAQQVLILQEAVARSLENPDIAALGSVSMAAQLRNGMKVVESAQKMLEG